jgi:Helicase HerA, central domain
MQEFEKLGKFYLGREYNIHENRPENNLLLYDSKDLTTHAVCVGMTGSGKTGLCIGLLEEAAIDNIPSIIIDPKGDLSNLLLTFPNLSPDEFLPWINSDEAAKKGMSPKDFARSQSELWTSGLAKWGQDSARVKKLKEAADFSIYTPGSSAGMPVSILSSFSQPPAGIMNDPDLSRERINTTVTSLLNLLDIDADPIQSREHILLSTIFEKAWKDGKDLGLGGLIENIQNPPISRIGVFELESFYPSGKRFELAMKLNNLLAAPGFSAWLEGEPLDIDRMFYTGSGKPRVTIFSIAHLDDSQRMFFVSLLLTQVLGWMRTQQGTSSLRAMLYMDEIFGFFPPVANPPSKLPLMTLLKQARAFGLGVVLATQNPADLDYKGLSNTGTWFIGRLQTERDKKRMLDGLETVEGSSGGRFDRKQMDQIISSLDKRVFLMNNIHEDQPVIFHTRWVMSYLRGPLTRSQIKTVTKNKKNTAAEKLIPATGMAGPSPNTLPKSMNHQSGKPVLPPTIPQYYIPVRTVADQKSALFYEPALLAAGSIYFADARSKIASEKKINWVAEFPSKNLRLNWGEARDMAIELDELEKLPYDDDATYNSLPETASNHKNFISWSKGFKDWLYRNEVLSLYYSPSLKSVSAPGESKRDFRIRLQQQAREHRDQLIEKLKKKYASKIVRLEDRIKTAESRVEREKEQARQQKLQTAISFGSTLLNALIGRKSISRSTLGRVATTAGRAGRILKEGKDIAQAKEGVNQLIQRLKEVQDMLVEEIELIESRIDPATEKFDSKIIKPRKMDINISLVTLVWVPYHINKSGGISPA